MKWFSLLILLCFLGVAVLSPLGCGGSISEEEREQYLRTAESYSRQAYHEEQLADTYWGLYAKADAYAIKAGIAEKYKELGQRYDELAKEYREQARHYRTLAGE